MDPGGREQIKNCVHVLHRLRTSARTVSALRVLDDLEALLRTGRLKGSDHEVTVSGSIVGLSRVAHCLGFQVYWLLFFSVFLRRRCNCSDVSSVNFACE